MFTNTKNNVYQNQYIHHSCDVSQHEQVQKRREDCFEFTIYISRKCVPLACKTCLNEVVLCVQFDCALLHRKQLKLCSLSTGFVMLKSCYSVYVSKCLKCLLIHSEHIISHNCPVYYQEAALTIGIA